MNNHRIDISLSLLKNKRERIILKGIINMKSSDIAWELITDIVALDEALFPLTRKRNTIRSIEQVEKDMYLDKDETDITAIEISSGKLFNSYTVRALISQYDISNDLVFSIPASISDSSIGPTCYMIESIMVILLEAYSSMNIDAIIE